LFVLLYIVIHFLFHLLSSRRGHSDLLP
jgi:hypothetical protein